MVEGGGETSSDLLSWKDVDFQRSIYDVASRQRQYGMYKRILGDGKTVFPCPRCRSLCTPREWEYHGCAPKGIGICIWCGKQIWATSTTPKWFRSLHQVACARSFILDSYVNTGDQIDQTTNPTSTFVGQLNSNEATQKITLENNTDSTQSTTDYSQQEKGLAYYCGITCDRIQRLETIILQEFSDREKTTRKDFEGQLAEMKEYFLEREKLLIQHTEELRKYNSVLQEKVDALYP